MPAHRAEPPDLTAASPGQVRRIVSSRPALGFALLLAAGFALFAVIHRQLSTAGGQAPALLIAIAWLAGCALMAGFGAGRPVATLLLTAAALVAVGAHWGWLVGRVDYVYLAQHAGSHALLGAWFGATLLGARRGRGDPLITRLATRVHGPLPPAIRRYTGAVTVMWTGYFALMALASCLLFAFGSLAAWSTLANLLTLPIIIALFIAEYAVRLRRHPDFEHVSILAGIRAFMRRG
ncbi:MAG: hypothetical protein AB7G13_07110 [Lautropia sp.]